MQNSWNHYCMPEKSRRNEHFTFKGGQLTFLTFWHYLSTLNSHNCFFDLPVSWTSFILVVENGQNFYSDNFWTFRPPHRLEISGIPNFCFFLFFPPLDKKMFFVTKKWLNSAAAVKISKNKKSPPLFWVFFSVRGGHKKYFPGGAKKQHSFRK